ncbi:amidoligase family protein [Pseudidiomarina sp. 1APP75-32.1]|uniref:Amidoligase family protein n=1 Tax=Pseudidiomarina terrestris TaxID=2820060 RepID=A0AAW7QX99_9GAMM|nr:MULTISPECIES: amidoligase family protein [unclassified Pseudidiomarina]MDN7124781.1 amidoligase family protein [Pseudidiomarina sp. 1APP75-32.1]MDN7129745.1 amidoligase family protein [Pseudidiomarina sp. 1APR75-15]MEA3588232.1 amidoligase family protein [Pseudidiomarina sp. 1APP75-27a]
MVKFVQPPKLKTSQGDIRRVGFELEFSGIDVATSAEAVAHALGGSPYAKSSAQWQVEGPLGDFKIEIDWNFLQRLAAEKGTEANTDALLDSLSQAAGLVVPVEVVCPPIACDQLDQLDELIVALRKRGAKGTDESMIAAYGTHINPELPDTDSETICRYMQAYALLQWWLVEQHHVNTTRKLSPFIDLYPEAYVRELLNYESVTINHLIDHYIDANPTRNRALDMLPLFSHLDDERVRAQIEDDKINARPTLHYRLPNCRIDDADWTLAREWNLWCNVERLANRPQALAELAADFLDADRPMLGVARQPWIKHVDQWLTENLASE